MLFVGAKALKVVELFEQCDKEYEARIKFGSVSTTYDREGVIEEVPERKGWLPPKDVELNKVLQEQFVGSLNQAPPAHSAVHVHGKRAYEIMHKNPSAVLELDERTVQVGSIQLLSYTYPDACIRIACSSGTYIRSIAHDLGQALRTGAYLAALKRTKVGQWDLKDACHIEKCAWADVVPMKDFLTTFPRIDLSKEQWEDTKHGRSIAHRITEEPLIAWHEGLPVALMEKDEKKQGYMHPRKVF